MLITFGIDPNVVTLLPATHEATGEMLNAVGYIDLCIPRGGKKLINFVRDTAKVPVIETGAGVVHCYFDKDGDLEMGKRIITNAKCRRVSVCNALDCLLIHENRLSDLPALCEGLAEKQTKIHQHFLLRLQSAGMRDFPKLRIQQIICSLTLPNLVHFGESIFYTRHREELIFCASDEEHRLRTGEGGDVRIVEILAKTGDAIRKTAILLSSESSGKLSIRGNHTADGSTLLDYIR